ncbi:MAG: HAD family hydrolase [Syntrophales bacterium]
MAPVTIKSVIFDFGGVLIDDPVPGIVRYCADYLKADPDDFRRVCWKYAPEFQKGAVAEDVFWRKICSELGKEQPRSASLWSEAFESAYSEKEDMFALASFLHGNGYKTGLLSDTEKPSVRFFLSKKYDMFDVLVFSCVEGEIKPGKRIYEIALQKIGLRPEETIFIDDKSANIRSAIDMNMNGIVFRNPMQVMMDLRSFSIDIPAGLLGKRYCR